METLGYILAITTGLIWGMIGISASELYRLNLNSYEISFLRTLIAFIAGYIFLKFTDKKNGRDNKLTKKNILFVIISGVMCQAGLNIYFTKSISTVGTITGIVLMATGPIFTIVLSRFLLNEKMGIQKVICLILAITGVVTLVTGGNLRELNFDSIGVIYGLTAGFCYGFFPILNKKVTESLDGSYALVYSFGVASLFLLFFLDSSSFEKFLQTRVISVSTFYAIVPTLLAYMLYVKAMLYIPASTASLITLLEIPATAIIGVFFLKEHLGIMNILGIILVIVGIALSKLKFKR